MDQNVIIVETTQNVIATTPTQNIIEVGNAGGNSLNIIFNEAPIGAVNGSNQSFTLAFAPVPSQNIMLHLNGVLLQQGNTADYRLSGTTITFNAGLIPQMGDSIFATYTF